MKLTPIAQLPPESVAGRAIFQLWSPSKPSGRAPLVVLERKGEISS